MNELGSLNSITEQQQSQDDKVLIGVNVVDLDRLQEKLIRRPSLFTYCFTQAEQEICNAMPQPQMGYASRFAAKLAVCKALGIERGTYICPRSIEVVQTSKGRPSAKLSGVATLLAKSKGVIEIPLSFSYTHSEAVACAMAITQSSVIKAKERIDQKQELTKQFRKARVLLDQLEGPDVKPEQESLPGIR